VAAVVELPAEDGDGRDVPVRRHRRPGGLPGEPPQPSFRLAVKARALRQSVLHCGGHDSDESSFTNHEPDAEWASCTPLRDEGLLGRGLYVAGRIDRPAPSADSLARDEEFNGNLKFAELVADVYGSVQRVRDLEYRVDQFGRYFSRGVQSVIAERDRAALLDARPTPVTVLFCDLRGSCRIAEEGAGDLPRVWQTVSEALAIMTGAILDNGGVVGDFQGDAAMGFWGWPPDGPEPDPQTQVERATKAALEIRRKFAQRADLKDHPLSGFACGIGLAHGPAIAGRIGTPDQFKIGVFGPVVNLAARLESLTKQFRVPILADDAVAHLLTPGPRWLRTRAVATVQPVGLAAALQVTELLLPADEPGAMAEPRRLDYEAAHRLFLNGKWDAATKLLKFPDGPSDRLKAFMAAHPAGPPAGWGGVIPLTEK
jgi:adenylate cyclase